MLFSGGEPLMRPDLPELAQYAVSKGMRAVISTNGTLITPEKARIFKDIGLSYVGISLDGLREVNDRFRGVDGAFDQALEGIRNCREAGIKVGLRFTVNKRNADQVGPIFDLLREENIPRVCFYHLVYAGRGSQLMEEDLDHAETRRVVDLIADRTKELFDQGLEKEVLTVDNHADGPYLYLRLLKEGSARAPEVLELLQMNEGNSSGRGIGCVSWDGQVHADQFWRHYFLWERTAAPLQRDLAGPFQSPHGPTEGKEKICHRPLRRNAAGWTFAEGTSGSAPKPPPGTSGPRTRPVT